MVTIRVNNDVSNIITDNIQLKNIIWGKMRFHPRNYFFSPAYRQKKWDGFVDFFNKTNGRFLTGLLLEVKLLLDQLGVPYKILDERTPVTFNTNSIDISFMNSWLPEDQDPIILQDYQVKLVNQAIKYGRGIIKAPTASGKAQPLDSLVATPTGFKKMGDLKVNDLVCVPSGGYAPITGVFPQGVKPIIQLELDNGDTVECCEDHLWKVNQEVISARDLFGKIKFGKFYIETPQKVDFEDMLGLNTWERRVKYLQDLMDTYGFTEDGKLCLPNHLPILIQDAKGLIQSLGGVVYLHEKHISFILPKPFIKGFSDYKTDNRRQIVNMKYIGEKICQCIMIDHPDHLYITDNFIVTHNTYIMLAIAKCLPPGTPILFLGNRKSVVRQTWKELIKWGFPHVGMLDGTTKEPNIITCATLQSLHHIERLLPKFKVLIVDEVHMMMSKTAIKAYRKLTGCNLRFAVSATPFKYTQKKKNKKEDSEGDKVQKYHTKGFFGPLFKGTDDGDIKTSELQEEGRLSKSRCTFLTINQPQIPFDIYLDAVTNGIATSVYFHKVVSNLAQSLKGRTLILVERIVHGNTLHQMIPGSFWIQGKDDVETRDILIEKLQKGGDVIGIATQGIFSVAINVFIHNFINAAGGQAEHDIIQRIGRGLRTAEDKKILNYYDFMFLINPYLEKHSKKRVKVLKEEGHEVIVLDGVNPLPGEPDIEDFEEEDDD